MAGDDITSFDDLPDGGRINRATYHVWNEGDIAHHLDLLPVTANPYSPETDGFLWQTWQLGWEGRPLVPGVEPPPPLPRLVLPRNTYVGGKLPRRNWISRLFYNSPL